MQTSIRSWRIGLLAGLFGTCTAAMAASPTAEPDGSIERPYPHLRQAAVKVVETARSALARRDGSPGTAPPVAVAHTRAVSPELVDAVRDVFSGAGGGRQTASGAWLEVLMDVQNRQQSGAYAPGPRAGLEQADLVLAIDEAQAASGLTLVRGALLTLRAGGPEQEHGAGEIVPGSAASVYVQSPGPPGLVVRGEGYCNRDFASDQWRYSALKAAEVDAAAALARARQGATVRESSSASDRRLQEHRTEISTEAHLPGVVIESRHFDPSSCRGVVTLTLTGASPRAQPGGDRRSFSPLRPLFSLVSIFF